MISYYEVMNGLYYKDAINQLEKFQKFVDLNQVLPLTFEVARLGAQIYSDLKKSGITIGHNDVLIGAIAIQNDLTLVTNNTNHFKHISGLEIDNWSI